MDIKKLKHFITLSNEDFADAHEPVNDGVKEVPDASDIAKMVTRSGGGGESDLTTQGEGKVIPEQPDSEEETEKKEETTVTETTEETKTPAKAPPFEKKEETEEVKEETTTVKEPELAHDDVETEKKEAFEQFLACESYHTAIKEGFEQIEHFKRAMVAVESYHQLLVSNKGRLSKQAAAIVQTGLSHIDATCSLRARQTGLESFDTTPRSALESVEVENKTLLGRAAELGAKILKWLKELFEKFETWVTKFTAGMTVVNNEVDAMMSQVEELPQDGNYGDVTLTSVSSSMYLGSEFVGDHITESEKLVVQSLQTGVKRLLLELVNPVIAVLNSPVDDYSATKEIEELITADTDKAVVRTVILPGNYDYVQTKRNFEIVSNDSHQSLPESQVFTIGSKGEYVKTLKDIQKYLATINTDLVITELRKTRDQLMKSMMRRRKANGVDEVYFQRLQEAAIGGTLGLFNVTDYMSLMRDLASLIKVRLFVLNKGMASVVSSNNE